MSIANQHDQTFFLLKLEFIQIELIIKAKVHLYVLFMSSPNSVSINVNHPFYPHNPEEVPFSEHSAF